MFVIQFYMCITVYIIMYVHVITFRVERMCICIMYIYVRINVHIYTNIHVHTYIHTYKYYVIILVNRD